MRPVRGTRHARLGTSWLRPRPSGQPAHSRRTAYLAKATTRWRCGCVWTGSYPRKDRPINFTLPKIKGAEDLAKALKAFLEAVTLGEITPEEGQTLTAMLKAYRNVLETVDFEVRLTALERRMLPE
jgi:hypothetical protein